MRRALVISYFYPPFGSVGAVRVSKLTKYLACHGWEPTVLAASKDDRPADIDIEIPAASIHRVPQLVDVMGLPRWLLGRKTIENRRFVPTGTRRSQLLWQLGMVYRNVVCFPDPQIGWLVPAVREGLRLIDEIRPDVILTSSSPNTAHLVGAVLTHRTGVPWVADFRDLWTDNHNFRRVAPLRVVERVLERAVLKHAAALVTVSDVWADALAKRFGKPTHVVPNGFDPLDYPDETPPLSKTFSLVYTGMFYNGKQNAAPVIDAIAALGRTGSITPETFQLRLVGHYLDPVVRAAEAAGVLPFVTIEPPVAYRDSLRLQQTASALLFFDWSDGRETGWYSAKIYEYLGARRPILSIGPRESVVAGLLSRTGAGLTADSSQGVRDVLERWLREQRTTGMVRCDTDPAALERYQRQTAARHMAGILNLYAGH